MYVKIIFRDCLSEGSKGLLRRDQILCGFFFGRWRTVGLETGAGNYKEKYDFYLKIKYL